MDKVRVLCEKDGLMMHEFSRRSLALVDVRSILSTTISFFSSYLEANIRKEVDKDGLVIRETAAALAAGRQCCTIDLEELFERTKQIDKAFLDGLRIPSFAMSVRYSDFADVRIRRIWLLVRTVYTLLRHWPDGASFRNAVRDAYDETEFREVIAEILHLYDLETRMLKDSIRSPFHKSISEYVEALYRAMETVKQELTDEYAKKLFRPGNANA